MILFGLSLVAILIITLFGGVAAITVLLPLIDIIVFVLIIYGIVKLIRHFKGS